ncbi:sensor histidine kinase [Rhodocyclus tenuis]|uniref:sensor histidine kinase n=1 Tax=Rhodocyclus tenuis TaxID=1066 RepID=UPI001F5B7C01|nr:sensor histidine kinase [Rhodocyclus tenuis]
MKSPQKSANPDSQRSLFGEILDWMLAPLLFVWPISIAVTHYFAYSVANFPYDQALREQANAVARQVSFVKGKAQIVFPGPARAMLRADEIDSVYFHVLGPGRNLLAGDRELPPPDDSLLTPDEPGEVFYRDTEADGRDLRVAYLYVAEPGMPRQQWLLVEVGETMDKRSQLANKIIASVILPQFVIIPLAVILVWFGLSRGLRPLTRLRERIEARAEGDLAPISARRVPEELQPLTDAFNAMIARLQQNMEVQRRFVADAAHQMRTPLTGLKTQAQLAMRERDPDALRHALEQIATSVDRASHLVDQLLALARAEASEHTQQTLQPLDLEQHLREVVSDWVMLAMERKIDLGFESTGSNIGVLGNALLLRELINNLIDNALRYTPAGGHVTCRVVEQGDFAVLEVEDSGIGISEEDAAHVFDRFYRVEGTGIDGSGLGLAIVREIAELHRAAASLRPNAASAGASRGAIARVVFPTYRVPPPPELPPPARSIPPPLA